MEDLFIQKLLRYARNLGCSDLHITHGMRPVIRLHGELQQLKVEDELDTDRLITEFLTRDQFERVNGGSDIDFCYVDAEGGRYRTNIYRQRGMLAAAFRIMNGSIPTLVELGLPPVLARLALEPRGLVLVTGPTGSGKSTTLAAMVDHINSTRRCHVLTIEDPVEYVHQNKGSMINQREVGTDVSDFATALRSALREDPDVILVGEMRDPETIQAAITAAETGHLVLSTLHTTGAAQTIDRIIDIYPGKEKQVCSQLAATLRGVVSQTLIKRADGSGRIAAVEVMTATDAISNLIRENKCYQIPSAMQTGASAGMQLLDNELKRLYTSGVISFDDAKAKAVDKGEFVKDMLDRR